MVELKSPAEIDAMRAAGQVVATALAACRAAAGVGVRLPDLDQVARDGPAGRRAAHAEHTVAITGDGPQILTAP